jgi:hypothetical protein
MNYIFSRLRKEGKDIDKLWRDIKDLIIKTFLSCEKKIGQVVSKYVKYRYILLILINNYNRMNGRYSYSN